MMIFCFCRHCIVSTGHTCTSCDAGKEEEVPLAVDEPATTASDFGNSDSVALESEGDSSATTTTGGGSFQSTYLGGGGDSQSQTGYQPTGGYQSGYQAGYQQGGYKPSGYQPSRYLQPSGQRFSSSYSNLNGLSSSAYNSGGYGTRSIRSVRSARKTMFITVGKDLKANVPLLKFMPAIKGLNFKVQYYIIAGNTTLFETSQEGRLGYLRSSHPLQQGSYALKISCKIKPNVTIDEEAKLWYSKKKMNLKLVVKVV